jgi:cytochrome c oxidase cbb3-type subunit 3
MMRWLLVLLAAVLVTGCEREHRAFQGPPTLAITVDSAATSLQAAQSSPDAERAPFDQNAYGVSEGKKLFTQFNCVGCHAQGGGAIGPALMDATWYYGAAPEQIYESVVNGRPNGMPAFSRRLTVPQTWQLVSYVRSLSGLLNADVRSGREDHMQTRTQDQALRGLQPRRAGAALPPP